MKKQSPMRIMTQNMITIQIIKLPAVCCAGRFYCLKLIGTVRTAVGGSFDMDSGSGIGSGVGYSVDS